MATATNSTGGFHGSGGAGGKFRKRPFKRSQATPYDRPVTALRPAQAAAAEAEKGGWLSKFVDPASKLITAGAHKLFSSVFRKRLLPPPPPPPQHPPDENTEVKDMHPKVTTVVAPSSTKEPPVYGDNDPSRVSGNNGVGELEDILKQMTFTRSEIDHLMALLHSRTVDDSAGTEKRSEAMLSDQQPNHGRNDNHTYLPAHENGIEHMVPAAVLTPAMRSKVLEDDVASPAELAKAYMGSRPRRVSPSVLGLHNQLPREALSATKNLPFKLRSPTSSLLQKPASDIGTSENGYSTPRFRGKSAIYCMARTPYSRIHPAATFKASETAVDANGGTFSSHNATEYDQLNGSKKQVLKRRSSVLENDIGSVGPIRRIRQKPNLLHPKILNLPASGVSHATHVSGMLSDAAGLPPSSNQNSHNHSFSKLMADNSVPSTSSGYVPSQSIETAQKIFQQLDKFTPKGKSPELKLNFGGVGSPNKMTPAMLGGLARRSMEAVDSLEVLQSSVDVKEANGQSTSADAHGLMPNRSLRVEVANQKIFAVSSDKLSPQDRAEARMPATHSSDDTKVMDVALPSGLDHAPKKRAFQMSAHEDYLEMDDDVHSNGVATTQLSEGDENAKVSGKSTAIFNIPPQDEAIAEEQPAVLKEKPSVDSLLSKESEFLSDGPATAGKVTGFTFPVVPSTSPASSLGGQVEITAPQSTSVFDKVVPQSESVDVVSTFSIKSDKLLPITFPTSPSVAESALEKDSKPVFPNSGNHAVGKATGPAENDKESTQEVLEVVKKSSDYHSPVISSAKGIFNFGSPANNATVNGGLPSAAPTISSPALFSSTASNQNLVSVTFAVSSPPLFTGGSSLSNGFAASTSTSTTAARTMGSADISSSTTSIFASSSQQSSSVIAPSVSSGSIFQFGTTVPSNSGASGSAPESAENSGAKFETAFGNSTSNSLFSTKSSTTAPGGSGIFGFNASTLKTASGESQTTAPTASDRPIFGFQASSPTAPVSTPTPSFPSQFPSSSSSPGFGLGGATGLSSGVSVFTANTSSSGSASASGSLGASSMSSSVSSSSGTASSIFGSSWQPSKPAIPTFGITSPSTGFSFAASASGSSTDSNKTPVVFVASTSSSSATGNSAPLPFGAASSSSAPVFSFSSTISTPSFSSQPAFGNSTSQTFAFNSTPSGNNDQMSMEDSMAEDSVQTLTPAAPVFSQPPISTPSSGFVFGGTPSPSFGGAAPVPTGNPFQFGSQPNQMAPQSPSPFKPSGSVEFNAGGAGSFSLGTGGDKANRKIVKVKNRVRRK